MTPLAVVALLTLAVLAWKLRGARKDAEHWEGEAARWEEIARASDDARKKAHERLRTRRYVDKVMRDERAKAERKESLSRCQKFGHAIPNRYGQRICGRCWKTEREITRERSDK